eukprot:10965006-Ditylum_brightwellii.AAC.1
MSTSDSVTYVDSNDNEYDIISYNNGASSKERCDDIIANDSIGFNNIGDIEVDAARRRICKFSYRDLRRSKDCRDAQIN